MEVIKVNNLYKLYGDVQVLKDVSLKWRNWIMRVFRTMLKTELKLSLTEI
ncbi:hypothetical protein [Clostridium isatidis]|nr:hypothetical protein [Clostridium isatidis]